MKGHTTEVTQELIDKVVRRYADGMSLSQMSNFGICNSSIAAEILRERGLLRKPGDSAMRKSIRPSKIW
jgi:hypothetical protein